MESSRRFQWMSTPDKDHLSSKFFPLFFMILGSAAKFATALPENSVVSAASKQIFGFLIGLIIIYLKKKKMIRLGTASSWRHLLKILFCISSVLDRPWPKRNHCHVELFKFHWTISGHPIDGAFAYSVRNAEEVSKASKGRHVYNEAWPLLSHNSESMKCPSTIEYKTLHALYYYSTLMRKWCIGNGFEARRCWQYPNL